MEMCLRDNKRYGIFKADSNIGRVNVEIYKFGFGEKIEVFKDKKFLYEVNTLDYLDDDDDNYSCCLANYQETEDELIIGDVKIKKPFLRCIKRFK
jgi:hypothetical protein